MPFTFKDMQDVISGLIEAEASPAAILCAIQRSFDPTDAVVLLRLVEDIHAGHDPLDTRTSK